MRKKLVSVILGLVVMCAFVGCSTKEKVDTPNVNEKMTEDTEEIADDIQNESTENNSEDLESSDAGDELDEETMRAVFDENLNCMYHIFGLGSLMPIGGEYDASQGNLVQVDPSVYPDWDSFEAYIRSVYCKETADMYLYNYPYEGDPKYINQDGMLYVNMEYDGGKGYYVDWSDYQIEITNKADTRVDFKATATIEEPGDEPVMEPYEVTGAFVLEDGNWLLEQSVF